MASNDATTIGPFRVRHYHAEAGATYTPYRGVLHDPLTDARINHKDLIYEFLRLLPEGSRVTIIVQAEHAEVAPDDYWCLLRPHEYGPAPKGSPAPKGNNV